MIAFTTAAMTPIAPPNTPMMLKIPPRRAGERDKMTPKRPATIATPAKKNPKNTPTLKLRIAAMTATMEGMLKAAFEGALELMVGDAG